MPTPVEPAQISDDATSAADALFHPRAVAIGGITITPRIATTIGYNDNVTLASSRTNTPFDRRLVRSGFAAWTPEVTAVVPGDADDSYVLRARGEFNRYAESAVNDTNNFEVAVDGLDVVETRTALAWRLSVQDGHDVAGSTNLSLQAVSPDHFRAEAAGAVLRQDDEAGRDRTEAEASVSRRRYLDHRDITRLGDVDILGFAVRRFGPASDAENVVTRWLIEGRAIDASYPSAPRASASLNNLDHRVLIGWQREATQDTDPSLGATVKLGVQRKTFDGARPIYTGPTWEVVVIWQAESRMRFEAASSRAAADAPGDGSDTAVIRQASATWTALWQEDLRSTVTMTRGVDRYRYSGALAAFERRDRVDTLELAFHHDLRRDLQVGFAWSFARRRSTASGIDYLRRVATLVVESAL